MRVLITGADGFIGRNLRLALSERPDIEIVTFVRDESSEQLLKKVSVVDFIFHLAGTNRPIFADEYMTGNADLTKELCCALIENGNSIPIIYTSSTQAMNNNAYGVSKRAAELYLCELREKNGNPVHIFRLPNTFGKWAKPHYNSVIATFCHNIARDYPITVNDPATELTLAYIDDVIANFVAIMDGSFPVTDSSGFVEIEPLYRTTLGDIVDTLEKFRNSNDSLITEPVGYGFVRALYATYVSYLPVENFSYTVPMHKDPRGVFVEMLKTYDSGQFSYFTAKSGVTRGGHYHHSKTEKFLVIKGEALFRFRHMVTGETYSIQTIGECAQIVETVPGWTHDITNIGDEDLIVMLWANEIFDRNKPDTFASAL
jgi:UDP-2-acetamido-2,6-beta-L-arabino-hexul-4-ose reductase